jgi:hypothetical protein
MTLSGIGYGYREPEKERQEELDDEFGIPSLAPLKELTKARESAYYTFDYEPPKEQGPWELRPVDRIKKSSWESLGALSQVAGLISGTMGYDGGRDYFMEKAVDIFEKAASKYDLQETGFDQLFASEAGIEDFAKWGAETITSYIPDLALMVLGGAGGATAAMKAGATETGKAAAKKMLRSKLAKNVKAVKGEAGGSLSTKAVYEQAYKRTLQETGALAGMATYEGSLQGGQGYAYDLEQNGDEASAGAAWASGVGSAAVTIISPVNRLIASRFGSQVITSKGLRTVGEMTLGEAAEEVGQEVVALIHEAGVNKDLTLEEAMADPQTAMRLAEAGVSGALIGGVFGGGRHALRADKAAVDQAIREKGVDPDTGDVIPNVSATAAPLETFDAEWERNVKEAQAYVKQANDPAYLEIKKRRDKEISEFEKEFNKESIEPAPTVEPTVAAEAVEEDPQWERDVKEAQAYVKQANDPAYLEIKKRRDKEISEFEKEFNKESKESIEPAPTEPAPTVEPSVAAEAVEEDPQWERDVKEAQEYTKKKNTPEYQEKLRQRAEWEGGFRAYQEGGEEGLKAYEQGLESEKDLKYLRSKKEEDIPGDLEIVLQVHVEDEGKTVDTTYNARKELKNAHEDVDRWQKLFDCLIAK